MGLLAFKKKKPVDLAATTPQPERSANVPAVSERIKKWTPGRRKVTTTTPSTVTLSADQAAHEPHTVTASTAATPGPNVLSHLSVMALDDVEVMTFESQRALMDQREAIRKKLFENQYETNFDNIGDTPGGGSPFNMAMEASKEILASGAIRDAAMSPLFGATLTPNGTILSPSDRFSLPLEAVSRSWSGSLQKIAEEPVDYAVTSTTTTTTPPRRHQSGPVSVDVSYTESELASIVTSAEQQRAASTPNSHTRSLLNSVTSLAPQSLSAASTSFVAVAADEMDHDPEAVETSFTGSLSPNRRGPMPFYGKILAAASPSSNVLASTSVMVSSPAPSRNNSLNNTSTNSSVMGPLDERLVDHAVQEAYNKGKSPLKGMPDDERMEYQKDEMVPSPVSNSPSSPVDARGMPSSPDIELAPTENQQQQPPKEEEHSDSNTTPITAEQHSYTGTTSGGTSTSYTTSYGDSTTRTSSAVVPELARSILLAAFQCGRGALDQASQTVEATCSGTGTVLYGTTTTGTASATSSSMNVTGSGAPTTRGVGAASDAMSPRASATAAAQRRVYLDEASAVRFLRRITHNGFVLLYLRPAQPDDVVTDATVPTEDWKGNTVTMMIQKGCIRASHCTAATDLVDVTIEPPRLEWMTVTGGLVTDATTTSINLLDIQSILTNDDDKQEDEDLCFFTITDGAGEVHIFEAATLEERNRIVHGLKTIIARWSFQLIAGDLTATSELYTNHATSSVAGDVDLPSLPNPSQTMNRVAHMLIDVGC
jgi:hypothetical protein